MKSAFTFFKWGFFLLVALNITLIILVVFPKEDHHHRPDPSRFDRIIAHLDDALELSDKQHATLVQLFERHKHEIDSIHRQSAHQHNEMINCLKAGEKDCEALNVHVSFEQILFEHHNRIIGILNASQKKQYLIDLDTHRPAGPPPF